MDIFMDILKLVTIIWLVWATVIGVSATKRYRRAQYYDVWIPLNRVRGSEGGVVSDGVMDELIGRRSVFGKPVVSSAWAIVPSQGE